MIGQVWPVANTGYSILESGEINRQTLQLDVQGYLIADPRGNTLAKIYADRASAYAAALEFAADVHKSGT
ncbi:MAG: hypothetical protein V4624_08640 [Pseudomonadota bacterium]